METSTEWLKHNKDPLQVRARMKETVHYRHDFIHSERPDVEEILQKFPRIMDQGMVC